MRRVEARPGKLVRVRTHSWGTVREKRTKIKKEKKKKTPLAEGSWYETARLGKRTGKLDMEV